MNFVTRLFLFAIAMTVGVGGYKAFKLITSPREQVTAVRVEHGDPAPAEGAVAVTIGEPPAPPIPPEAVAAMHAADAAAAAEHAAWDVRIATTNGAAFLGLRDNQLVAGLSDSIRTLARTEMRKEMAKEPSGSGLGRVIEKAVANGVEGILAKQIEVPLEEIRSIDYRRNRIEIRYKRGEPSGVLNFETIKSDGDKTLLEQFSEQDAKRLVAAVQARLK